MNDNITQQSIPTPYAQMRNGMGTSALVLGIVGAVFGLIPLFWWVALILGILAVVFGVAGRRRADRQQADNRKMATWGAVLGIASLVLSIIGLVIFVNAMTQLDKDLNEIDQNLSNYSDCIDRTPLENWSICDQYLE